MSDPAKELRILEAMRDTVGDFSSYVTRSELRPITPYDDLHDLPAVGFYPGETEPAVQEHGVFICRFIVMAEVVASALDPAEILPLLYQIGKDLTRMMMTRREDLPIFGIDGFQEIELYGASDLAGIDGGDQPTGARVFRYLVTYRSTFADLLAE